MERLRHFDIVRLIGITMVFGLVWWSIDFHQDAVLAMEPRGVADQSDPAGEETVADVELTEDNAPRYLAFAIGFKPGAYDIADPPDSRDRDYTARTTIEPETGNVSAAFANFVPPERGELNPGLYGTAFGVEDCSFQLRRVMRTKTERVIGQEFLSEGRLLVTINEIEPDRFVSSPSCGDWVPWSPVAEPLESAGNGDYWIGDLQQGTWTVPTGCIWEKVVGFRGASLWDVEDSAWGPTELVVDDETLGVRIRGCGQPLTLQVDS